MRTTFGFVKLDSGWVCSQSVTKCSYLKYYFCYFFRKKDYLSCSNIIIFCSVLFSSVFLLFFSHLYEFFSIVLVDIMSVCLCCAYKWHSFAWMYVVKQLRKVLCGTRRYKFEMIGTSDGVVVAEVEMGKKRWIVIKKVVVRSAANKM